MDLTKYQKELIDDFISGNIFDIYSFLENKTTASKINNTFGTVPFELHNLVTGEHRKFNISKHEYIYKIESSQYDSLCNLLFEFVFLCDYLEGFDLKLIRAFQLSEKAKSFVPILELIDGDVVVEKRYSKVNQVLFERYRWEFVASPALRNFASNSYISNQEKRSRTTLTWTRFAAIGAVVLTIASTVFNFFTYRTERDVNIKNKNAFLDTSKIILINPENLKTERKELIDSVKNK